MTVDRQKRMTVTMKLSSSLLLLSILLAPGSTHDRGKGMEPEFDVHLPNLTVKLGSDAAFTCIVKHLGEYKVAWIRSEDKAIIALHNHMVTHNHRFSVTHNGHNTWTLHVKNVQQNDSGSYMCQINTDPQRSQFGTLEVVVPADIVDEETSNDVVVSEGQSASLKCKATGHPLPKVRWRRQDGNPLPLSKDLLANPAEKIDVWEGEILPMRPLHRTDTGSFLCIANNSVPPLVSKRVMVYVHFHPLIKVVNQLVAAPVGTNVTLECYIEAVPRPVVSWFNKGQLILNQVGRIWQESEPLKDYNLKTKLTISNLRLEDFSEYNCTAGSSLGTAYAVIKLQEIRLPPSPKTTPSTTTVVDWRIIKHGKHSNHLNNVNPNANKNNINSDKDSNGNSINHSKGGHRRKSSRTKEPFNDDYDNGSSSDFKGGEGVVQGDGLTTSSSLSKYGKRDQKDTEWTGRLDPPPYRKNAESGTVGVIFSARIPLSLAGSFQAHFLRLPLIIPVALGMLFTIRY